MTDSHDLFAGTRSPTTSLSLLDRARARSDEAWARIVYLYSPLIEKWCRRSGLPEQAALDVGQEVFASVYARLDDFEKVREGQSFRAWLRTITRCRIADHFRDKVRCPEAVQGCDEAWLAADQVDGADEPAEERSEAVLVLRRCLELVRGEFETKTWQAFWDAVVEEKAPEEIAARLGLTRNAVYLAKSRVMRRFKDLFDRLVEGLETPV